MTAFEIYLYLYSQFNFLNILFGIEFKEIYFVENIFLTDLSNENMFYSSFFCGEMIKFFEESICF